MSTGDGTIWLVGGLLSLREDKGGNISPSKHVIGLNLSSIENLSDVIRLHSSSRFGRHDDVILRSRVVMPFARDIETVLSRLVMSGN
ncbi:hypothetical protein TNCV_4193221 [Trichonephila clavipes]|nr:hypothetical protein TNCV_4193221 [Trichonephila clavipes]